MIDQAHFALGLCLHDAHQVGVGHGGEWVILHAALVQQHSASKQITFEDGAAVVGKRRRGNGELAIQGIHQSFGDRADIAFRCAVKS